MNKAKNIVGVIILTFLVAIFVARTYISKALVGWDEAVHIYSAYRIYHSFQKRDLILFLKATVGQIHYPPFQSWVYGFPLLLSGFSIEKARIVGLFWFIFGAVLVFLMGEDLGKKHGKLAGSLSLFFYLTSPMILLFSALVMKELIGGVVSLLVIFVYFKAKTKKTRFSYFLVSLVLFTLTMTKYNYGLHIAAVIFLEELLEFFLQKKLRVFFSHLVLIFLPFSLFLGMWIFRPYNNLPFFLGVIANKGILTKGMTNLWGILLFYPLAIVYMYSATEILGIFLLTSFGLCLLYFKDFRIRTIWLVVALNLFLGIIYNWNMQERYFLTCVPFLFLLGSFVFVNLWPKFLTLAKKPFFSGVIIGFCFLAGIKILVDLVHLPNYIFSMAAYTLKMPAFNQTDYDNKKLWFNYQKTSWPKQLPPGSYEKPLDLVEFVASSIDLTKPVKIIGYANEFSPDYFDLVFAFHREKKDLVFLPYSSFLVTLEYFPTSRFGTRDDQRTKPDQIKEIRKTEKDKSLNLLAKKNFEDLDIKVLVYGKK